jgi:exopolysaccharide biosynthesis polyprenyl glycosylphosphotransferase
MSRSWSGRLLLYMSDVFVMNLAFYIAFRFRFSGSIPMENLIPYLNLAPYLSFILIILFWLFGLYEGSWRRSLEIVYSVMLSVVILNVVAMALTYFLRGFAFPRTVFFIAGIMQVLLLGAWRLIWQTVVDRTEGTKTVAVLGTNGDGLRMAEKLASLAGRRYNVRTLSGVKASESLPKDIEEADIVCINSSLPRDERERVITACLERNKEVFVLPELYEILLHNASVERIDDVTVFRVEGLGLTRGQQLMKRLLDLSLAAFALVFVLPLFPIIALAVRLSSPGPIFYVQKRTGLNGKPFTLWKFRTMVQDAEKLTGPVLASENDPRVTKVGRFLRATRLDELPQIFNVIKGDMSFVGPRPERPFFVQQFCETIPEYKFRLKVKPGITGLAQVQGKYDTDPADKLRYDLYYIRNYSPLLDLQIIFQTLRVMLTPEAARGTRKAVQGLQNGNWTLKA